MPNRLAAEASPYLLQHARNPVDWWPWCDEALAEAKRRDVPILLSIGYSACHWCHVMEHESFENEAIAALMNEHFVCIKVDREERPDLDQIYQLVVQLMGRSGGWPLTVFLTPAQKPFFGGTYFPPSDRYGMPGFGKVLLALSQAYREKHDEVQEQAAELTRAIAEVSRGAAADVSEAAPLGPDLLERVSRLLLRRVDARNGGFGDKPKFPNTMPLEVVLRRGVLEGDGVARDAARLQLESMRRGGIWDHLGDGFHRYSTDERWLVPHFEKMLYDNALLLRSYVDGHRVFGAPLFADTARAIASYSRREMTDPSGGYYATQDADSEGEEGKFFVWDPAEVREALGADEDAAKVALAYYGVRPEGNFEEHGRATGKTVLHESQPIGAIAARLDRSEEEVRAALDRARKALFEAREKRVKPFRDEKILTSWNALMIGAMAEAGAALGDPALVDSAERACAFVQSKLVVAQGAHARALRLVKGDVVKGPGFLDDHAYLANALLDLYEVTGDPTRVAAARALVDGMIDAFWEDAEGFYFTPKDGEALITRSKDPFDSAVPSGVSMACRALLRLGALVDTKYAAMVERELLRLAPQATSNPMGFGQALCEMDRLVRGSVDVVLVGARGDARTQALAREVFATWIPNRTVAWLDERNPASREACALLAEGKPAKDVPVAYVCRGRTCSLPVRTPEDLAPLLTPQ
ncbi:Thymidylate kinase [Labilithrix luteola]|uniref:Thymidylate kinase n=1 Tax=Labilithrix luteola TaxID=1391654 RepID=A0A0K1PTS2_9BACT|nr:thioredoxin domain-containing protein [Labilithrix luteola]AKU96943.1 Thymidylate kinase [Labilithrix luteola]